MIEIEDRWIDSYDIKRKDISDFFHKLNYYSYYFSNNRLIKCDINSTKNNNVIFLPKEIKT